MDALNLESLKGALCEHFTRDLEIVARGASVRVVLPTVDLYGDSLVFTLGGSGHARYLSDEGFAYHQIMELTNTANPQADIWRRVGEIAMRHGVRFEDGELLADATSNSEIAYGLLGLSAALTESLYLGRSSVAPFGVRFEEEVGLFLRDHRIPHEVGQKILGQSKAPHRIDFLIKSHKSQREIVAQAVASEQSMRRALNVFYDLTEGSNEYIPIAFVDDERSGYSNTTFTQLNHKANVFIWTERARFLEYWNEAQQPALDRQTWPIPNTETA